MTTTDLFTIQTSGPTMTIEVHGPVSSLASDEALKNLDRVLDRIQTEDIRDVVIDFQQSPYFGSCMLETLRQIWNDVHRRGGRLVLCNLSPVGQEIIHIAKFDQLWPVVATREDADQQLETMC